jgi:hypothetical protein
VLRGGEPDGRLRGRFGSRYRKREACDPWQRRLLDQAAHTKTITIKLTRGGRKLLHADHGRLTATLTVTEKLNGHTVTSVRTTKLKPARR